MARHAYKARDEQGRLVRGELEAPDPAELRETLRLRNLFLVDAREIPLRRGGSVSRDELILFTFHLQAVFASGIPLIVGLNDLAQQTGSRRFQRVVEDVRDAISQGATMRQALGRHPRAFPASYVHMVEAGEMSGQIDEILGRLVHLLEWSAELRNQLRQLLTYPAVVCTAMLGLVILLLTFVLPRFSEILETLSVGLPWPTRLLMAMSRGCQKYWPFLLAGGAVLAAISVILLRTPSTRRRLDALALRLPVVGPLNRASVGSQIAHFLGGFAEAGVPIDQGLTLLAGVVSNRHASRRIEQVRNRVLGGDTLTQAFAGAAILPPLVHRMLAIGEETGQIPRALRRAEEYYDRDIPRRVKRLMDLMGPALTVVLGAILLFVLSSVLLPLYRAYSAIGGGT
jgi:type IV pilus assembly protein PilC